MPTTARGRILDAAGRPVTNRKFALQALGADGWTTLSTITDGTVDLKLPASGRGGRTPVPLRLVDPSSGTVQVVSSTPDWSTEGNTRVADFGRVQLLEEPVLRRRADGQEEPIIGIPLDDPVLDVIRDPVVRPGRGPIHDDITLPDSILEIQLELNASQAELSTTKLELIAKDEKLEQNRLELARKDETLGQVRLELSEALTQVDTLTTRLGTPTRVVDVIAGLGSQLSVTNTELAKQPTPFRLAEVSLDLRGRLGNDGETIVMDGSGDGSGLHADLVVDATVPEAPTQGVPDVLGLTASAAARVLRSVGFSMDSATQRLPAGQGVPGQAVAQQPAPGGEAEFGATVLVAFGVRTEDDE